jgi:hypothetical protein
MHISRNLYPFELKHQRISCWIMIEYEWLARMVKGNTFQGVTV